MTDRGKKVIRSRIAGYPIRHPAWRIRLEQLFIFALFQQCVEMPECSLETILRGV